MIKKLLYSLFILMLLGGPLGASRTPVQAAPVPDEKRPTALDSNRYGYVMDDSVAMNWVDAVALGTPLTFPSSDDSFTSFSIGFAFKFYENSYTTVYVSTNGLITFGNGSDELTNTPIPWDASPNNLVAPFWTDLRLNTGTVYKRMVGSAPNRQMVIEWYQVHDPALTFEAILSENGEILFQYQTVQGEAASLCTIGIEDASGTDGLQYVYNDVLLSQGKAIKFSRPAATARATILPRSTSDFAINQSALFNMVVRNTGELGADIFDLATTNSNADWAVTLIVGGSEALPDTNGNGLPDTGSLAQGASVTVGVRLTPAAGKTLAVGSSTEVMLKATSNLNSSLSDTAFIKSAVPLPFAQVYVSATGIHLRTVWEKNVIDRELTDKQGYTGKTLAVKEISEDNYLVAWEKRSDFYRFTEIAYTVVSQLSMVGETKKLSNSESLLVGTVTDSNAEAPTIARAPNGLVVALWEQHLQRNDGGFNTNLYMVPIGTDGNAQGSATNLTQMNDFYFSSGDYREILYHNVVATEDNRFFACWVEDIRIGGVKGQNLRCGGYAIDGGVITQKVAPFIVDSPTGADYLEEPGLARISGNRLLLTYKRTSGGTTQVVYAVRSSSDGSLVKEPTVVSGAAGTNPQALQFSNGSTLLTWAGDDGLLYYLYLDSAWNVTSGYPKTLPQISLRPTAYPSLSMEEKGRAILSWIDGLTENDNYLYYVVLDQDGVLVTPPMRFLSTAINTSTYGYGLAAYKGVYRLMLPYTNR